MDPPSPPASDSSPSADAVEARDVWHLTRSGFRGEKRRALGESPLRIEVGKSVFVLMRTPGDDILLALGFLMSESIIESLDEVVDIQPHPEQSDAIVVELHPEAPAVSVERNMVVNSSCGLCGRQGILELIAAIPRLSSTLTVRRDVLFELPLKVRTKQSLFEQTGGAHAAALFDAEGTVVAVREDIGRHNALDKVLGYAMKGRLDPQTLGVFLSGRASLEMVIKAGRGRIGLVAAVSAASDAAIEAADRLSMTLCGFVRGDEVLVYTHRHRIGS